MLVSATFKFDRWSQPKQYAAGKKSPGTWGIPAHSARFRAGEHAAAEPDSVRGQDTLDVNRLLRILRLHRNEVALDRRAIHGDSRLLAPLELNDEIDPPEGPRIADARPPGRQLGAEEKSFECALKSQQVIHDIQKCHATVPVRQGSLET